MSSVVISLPSGEHWYSDFAMSLIGILGYPAPGHQIMIDKLEGGSISLARNLLAQNAIKAKADYMLFLDTDMLFPRDTLARLLSHGKEVVGCVYRKRKAPYTQNGIPEIDFSCEQSALREMETLPGGCLLIKTSVFDKLKFPYFAEHYHGGHDILTPEDYYFSLRAREAGFQVWCDTKLSREIDHIGKQLIRI